MTEMIHYNIKLLILSICVLIGCSGNQEKDSSKNKTQAESPKITLTKVEGSPEYANATLTLEQPTGDFLALEDSIFDFKVSNFDLGSQTSDAATKGLANSGNGQHIHFILDNGPYSAHYESQFPKSMEPGNHIALAFLSRSYHESVKNPKAFILKQWQVGDTTDTEKVDLSKPHMFYSRPKGTYKGDDTKKLLLDFYLVNITLSAEGNKVRATINGGQQFMIDEWAPYQLEGLSLGEVTIKLELLDGAGQLIDSPFNPVERKVSLK